MIDSIIERTQRRNGCLLLFSPTHFSPSIEKMILGQPFDKSKFDSLSLIKKILLFSTYAQFRRANPRAETVLSQMAKSVLSGFEDISSIEVLLPSSWTHLNHTLKELHVIKITQYDEGDLLNQLQNMVLSRTYDEVYLFYPDALGLGWFNIERVLLKSTSAKIIIINGRKRMFELNKSSIKKLTTHRFIERSWIPETLLIMVLIPLSLLLFMLDFLKGKQIPNHDLT